MKKILFSSAAALAVVVGMSSYKEAARVSTFYFDVTASKAASVTQLRDADVQIRQDADVNPGDVCSGTTKLCIVSFLTSQLTAGKVHLNTAGSPISIQARISTKN